MRLETLSKDVDFTGLAEESWFFGIFAAIEWIDARFLHDTMPFFDRIQQLSVLEFLHSTKLLTDYIREIQAMLLRMREGCDPEIVY